MKKTIIWLLLIIIIGVVGYFLMRSSGTDTEPVDQATTTPQNGQTGTTTAEQKETTIIGESIEGRDIIAYHFGEGDTKLLFVGGLHGGYSWNTALVAYELMDYLKANPDAVPQNIQATVIPTANPDGLFKVTGKEGRFAKADVATSQDVVVSGRFNANNVDLNRNFDCDWQATGTWQNRSVSGGTSVFSEPESIAMRDYVNEYEPEAVLVWYSASGGVFASNCHEGILPETQALTDLYAQASGYPAYQTFDFYAITGDMVNWLAKEGIPAISVLLTTHDDTEWSKNQAGIDALLQNYAN